MEIIFYLFFYFATHLGLEHASSSKTADETDDSDRRHSSVPDQKHATTFRIDPFNTSSRNSSSGSISSVDPDKQSSEAASIDHLHRSIAKLCVLLKSSASRQSIQTYNTIILLLCYNYCCYYYYCYLYYSVFCPYSRLWEKNLILLFVCLFVFISIKTRYSQFV